MRNSYRPLISIPTVLGLLILLGGGGCDSGGLPPPPPPNECDSCPAAANAQPVCVNGHCGFTCDAGFADCDGNPATGCEFDLDTDPPGTTYADLGTLRGDAGADEQETTAAGERWYRVYLQEANSACVSLSVTVQLTPGVGTDYDLYVYDGNLTTLAGSSTNGGTTSDVVSLTWNDECILGIPTGADQGRYLFVLVKFYAGANCNNFTLTINGNT